MKVLKFGGTSVGSVDNLKQVFKIVTMQSEPCIVVVSAFSGVTNLLQDIAHNAINGEFALPIERLKERHFSMVEGLGLQNNSVIETFLKEQFTEIEEISKGVYALQELTNKSIARIMAKGELLSSKIIVEFFKAQGANFNRIDSRELITAEGDFLTATVQFKQTEQQCQASIDTNQNYIIPGFIASNELGQDMLLGRGGSDYTASIVGMSINATQVELWSDVNGMQNANPRVVKEAKTIAEMSYEEAFEIAYFGAKVLYPPAIKPAMRKNIPVWLKNTVQPSDKGTIIHQLAGKRNDQLLGVSTLGDISLINVTGVGLSGVQGSAKRVFEALEQNEINIILISQSCSEQSICIGLKTADAPKAKQAIETAFAKELEQTILNPVEVIPNQVILALIGDQMKDQVGLSGQVFTTLGENNINISAIAQGSSERNISIVINEKDEHKALNVVHERFFQDALKRVHLFVFGKGNVGNEFIDILYQQQEFIQQEYKTEVRLVMVANSKEFILNQDGLEQSEYNAFNGTAYNNISELVEKVKELNLRNSIVVDNTASKVVSDVYPQFFEQSISVATCNKIASSSPFEHYQNLKTLTKQHNCQFLYETAVGASLPVIKTIQNIVLGGDKVNQIEAVLSGSLNFIFNNYDGNKPFVEIVEQAMELGFTEPDPRIDLSGLDVRRKLLILARESGKQINLDDVLFDSFLPERANNTNSVEEFLQVLKEEEGFFKAKLEQANNQNAKLKVVAQMKGDNYVVGLQHILADSPFYHLGGKDNIVALTTNLYNPEPLIVKGAGAGARVTAAGVFSDFMYIVNQK